MDTKRVIEYIFLACISTVGTVGVSYVQTISVSLLKLSDSVVELNNRLSIMTTRLSVTDDSLKDHESRLRRVERRR